MREHTEKLNPPRALFVPFELGRPVGAPDDAAFQRRVLDAAFALFDLAEGPAIEDFPEDAPGGPSGDMSGWVCPVNLAPPPEADAADGALAAVRRELDRLRPWHQLARERRGRTTVGLSGLGIDAATDFIARFLADPAIESPIDGMDLPQALKFAADDFKAWYLEAATARPGPGGAAELADWFWRETAGGKFMMELCLACRALEGPMMQLLGRKALVPRVYEHLLPGLNN